MPRFFSNHISFEKADGLFATECGKGIMNRLLQYLNAAIISALILVSCSGDNDKPPPPPVPDTVITLKDRFHVDGTIDYDLLTDVRESQLTFLEYPSLSESHSETVKCSAVNDDIDIYLAIEWTDDDKNTTFSMTTGPVDYDGIHLLIDTNGNGVYEDGEDKKYLVAASVRSVFVDAYRDGTSSIDDKTGDGLGCVLYHSDTNSYHAEFIIPLSGDASGHDGTIDGNTRFNLTFTDHYQPDGNGSGSATGYFSMLVFDDTDSSDWPAFPLTESEKLTRPERPDDLSGLIIFASMFEDPDGEIYTYNPQTGVITQVTDNSLYETTISLSNNRDKIAFLGAPESPETSDTAALQSEVYVINTDGTNLVQLTDNGYMDGHPAWSPDDSKIVYGNYSPFNPTPGAHIMIMNADGSNKTDLTVLSDSDANVFWFDEMDPDFLPDGRIIFKTNRFFKFTEYSSTDFELQIAVMNQDGSNVTQLTSTTGIVDHDPMGHNGSVLFERMTGNYNYLDQPGAFVPWQIVAVTPDTKKETILVDDIWVNWLPVYDPTGNYIIYFRECGYNDLLLMTNEGTHLGRLIPDITVYHYLDWK